MEINRLTEQEARLLELTAKELQEKRNVGYDGTSEREEPIQVRKYSMNEKSQWDRIEQKLDSVLDILSKHGLQREMDKLGVKDIKL